MKVAQRLLKGHIQVILQNALPPPPTLRLPKHLPGLYRLIRSSCQQPRLIGIHDRIQNSSMREVESLLHWP